MTKTTSSLPQTRSHVWKNISAIVGPTFLDQLREDDALDDFKRLVNKACIAGHNPTGPVREVQALLGDRWSTLLLHILHFGRLRFSMLERVVNVLDGSGISRRMLSYTLRAMERDGIVLRIEEKSGGRKSEYELTPLGQEVWETVNGLVELLMARTETILSARAKFEKMTAAL